jgi:uncharacterized protein
MRIIALSDLHARTSVIPYLAGQLQKAHQVLLCGDITHFGRENEMRTIVQQIHSSNSRIFAVTGNCDYPVTEKYLADEGLALNARIREYLGYQWLGLSGSLPCPGRTPQEYTEEEYEARLNNLCPDPDRPLILVSHQPPYGTLNDQVSPGFHVGSRAIRQFIELNRPVICFTGHIHEGIAIDRIGETVIVNPGPAAKGNYAVADMEGKEIINVQLRNLFSEELI